MSLITSNYFRPIDFSIDEVMNAFARGRGYEYKEAYAMALKNAYEPLKSKYKWTTLSYILQEPLLRAQYIADCTLSESSEILLDVVNYVENYTYPPADRLYHRLVKNLVDYWNSPVNLLRQVHLYTFYNEEALIALQNLTEIMIQKKASAPYLLVGITGSISWYQTLTPAEKDRVRAQL